MYLWVGRRVLVSTGAERPSHRAVEEPTGTNGEIQNPANLWFCRFHNTAGWPLSALACSESLSSIDFNPAADMWRTSSNQISVPLVT